jgi:hypothetical protein
MNAGTTGYQSELWLSQEMCSDGSILRCYKAMYLSYSMLQLEWHGFRFLKSACLSRFDSQALAIPQERVVPEFRNSSRGSRAHR